MNDAQCLQACIAIPTSKNHMLVGVGIKLSS